MSGAASSGTAKRRPELHPPGFSAAVSEKSSSEELKRRLENLGDEDLGQYKM